MQAALNIAAHGVFLIAGIVAGFSLSADLLRLVSILKESSDDTGN